MPFMCVIFQFERSLWTVIVCAACAALACAQEPILPGFYADPSARVFGGKLYDDFNWPDTTLDRKKWWRGGLAGVDGSCAILNESDLTSSAMFDGGDFTFVIGGASASTRGLFGLGDIDDGDPYLVLSDSGAGWRFHVRNGSQTYTGAILAAALAKGDTVVFHWDSAGSSVSINGVLKDSQTAAHPPAMPLTLLEWNDKSTNGQLVVDSVSCSATAVFVPKPAVATAGAPERTMTLTAELVEDTFVDSSSASTCFNGNDQQLSIQNGRFHPDLTGAGGIVDRGRLALVQFTLPRLPGGWNVARARLAGVVALNHRLYGMPGWAPARPIELELLGLEGNPALATLTYQGLRDAAGGGMITGFTALGSVNFTFGAQAQPLDLLRFTTSETPAGSRLEFSDQRGGLREFLRSRVGQSSPAVVTLVIGPGRTQAVSGMECDFAFYAKENKAGRDSLSLTLELERE